MEKKTFMSACRDYFGLLPSQKPIEFGKEVKALTPADREEFTEAFAKMGVEIVAANPVGA